jgi:hypothetical protein
LAVECGVLELLMPEQDLDHADVDLLLKQMRREAVTIMPFPALEA